MATYFVRINSYWQNSADYFVGPFGSRNEADSAIEKAVSAPRSLVCKSGQMSSDVKNGIRVFQPVSKTDAQRAGMREDFMNNRNVLPRIPLDTSDLMEMNESSNY